MIASPGIFTGQGTDPSTGPLLILLPACYWAARASRRTAVPVSHPAPFGQKFEIFHPERTVVAAPSRSNVPGPRARIGLGMQDCLGLLRDI
jgi:hypothetical protein